MSQARRNGDLLVKSLLTNGSDATIDDNCFNSPKRKESRLEEDKKVLRENGITNECSNRNLRTTRSMKTMSDFFPKILAGKSHLLDDDENTCDSVESSEECFEQQSTSAATKKESTETVTAPNAKQSKQQKLNVLTTETTNLFLQEPVLKLDFDKTMNGHCIKTSFLTTEIKTKFQTLPPTDYINKVLNVNGSPHSERILSPERRRSIDGQLKTPPAFLLNTDSNSCDSGVVVSAEAQQQQQQLDVPINHLAKTPLVNALNGRRRKPTTPHRILCPSPVKSAPISQKNEPEMAQSEKISRKNRVLDYKDDQEEEKKQVEPEKTETRKKIVVTLPGPPGASKKVTEFFPVRRSVRKTKKEVQEERMRNIERAIIEKREEGLAIKMFDNKGRGIVTTRPFQRGEFVVEYIGDLISMQQANKREKLYAEDDNTGCYMYYFKYNNQQYW